jgi:putative DNA primase/helicase
MGGDHELVRYLQVVLGYCLTGHQTEKAAWFLHGETNTGKSTLLNVLKGVLRDYFGVSRPALIQEQKNERINEDDADLMGCRMVAMSETTQGARMDLEKFKRLTGGDPIKAERKYQHPFVFLPSHHLLYACNDLPTVRNMDAAVWVRAKVVPFMVQFSRGNSKRVDNLEYILMSEADGILSWLIEGSIAWYEAGRSVPAEPSLVREASQNWRKASDWLSDYLEDRVDFGPNYRCPAAMLWDDYVRWMTLNGLEMPPGKQATFAQAILAKKIRKIRPDGKTVYLGLRMKPIDTLRDAERQDDREHREDQHREDHGYHQGGHHEAMA